MAEIEFLPLPPKLSSSEEQGPERVEPVADQGVPSPPTPNAPTEGVPVPHASGTTFRTLTPEEIEREVLPDYQATSNPLPDPAISKIIGAFSENDDLIAYLVLQLKLHAQPLVIRQGHGSVLPGLVRAAEAHILSTVGPQWVYLFSPAGRMAQIAQTMGMSLEPWVVMSKLVQPEPPARPIFEIIPPEPIEPGPFLDESYQSRPDDDAFDALFPNGVMGVDPLTGRVN